MRKTFFAAKRLLTTFLFSPWSRGEKESLRGLHATYVFSLAETKNEEVRKLDLNPHDCISLCEDFEDKSFWFCKWSHQVKNLDSLIAKIGFKTNFAFSEKHVAALAGCGCTLILWFAPNKPKTCCALNVLYE